MRLLTIVFLSSWCASNACLAQSNTELPLGANNCAIAAALNLAQPIECIDPPLGQQRGIVIRLDTEIRAPQTTQNITVSAIKRPTPVVTKTKPKNIQVSHKAAKSDNGYFIHFALNSFELEPDYKEHLDRLAMVLSTDAMATSCLRITGHTDTTGNREYNMELSKKRAVMVGSYLAETGKLAADRVHIAARGESTPLPEISGQDPRNRRVEFATKETTAGCT